MTGYEEAGMVTRAFEEWRHVDRDIRVFMRFHLRLAEQEVERLWAEANRTWKGPDSAEEPPDILLRALDGVFPHDHEWMLLAAGVKDAVTAYEVYLEKAAKEIAHRHDRGFGGKPVYWSDLVDFYRKHLGLRIETPEVRRVRDIRHALTHQRGELRTTDQRQAFGRRHNIDGEAFFGRKALLTLESVTESCDVLAAEVRRVDLLAWDYSQGPTRSPSLEAWPRHVPLNERRRPEPPAPVEPR